MALVYADRVYEESTTTGTGTLTLDGAASEEYRTFSSAIGNGNTCYYSIALPDSAEWEVGLGTVAAGTLARTTPIASSNSNNAVNFSAGTKQVISVTPAALFDAIASHIADATLHFTEASISHANILNIGTNTHAQIDTALATAATHAANTSNPHSVTKTQVGLGNVTDDAQIAKSLVTAKGDLIVATGNATPDRLAIAGQDGFGLCSMAGDALGARWMGIAYPTVTVTEDTTLNAAVHGIVLVSNSTAKTITLPPASTNIHAAFLIKKIIANNAVVTIDADASETIDGALNKVLLSQYDWLEVVSDGAAWHVVRAGYSPLIIGEVHTGNGFGSGNTNFRRFTTTVTNLFSTSADSVANGHSFTTPYAGLYEAYAVDTNGTANGGLAIALNATNAAPAAIPFANRMGIDSATSGSSSGGHAIAIRRFAASDVLRLAAATAGTPGTSDVTHFRLIWLGN